MKSMIPVLVTVLSLVSTGFGDNKANSRKTVPLKGTALRVYVTGDGKQYVSTHPCVAGTWQFSRETKTEWIGALHYPTDNTLGKKGPMYYMVPNIHILKSSLPEKLPINLAKWRGTLVLEKKTADTKLTIDFKAAKMPAFRFVGWGSKPGDSAFFFRRHPELKYRKPK